MPPTHQQDPFADIAARHLESRNNELVQPSPPVLPAIQLPMEPGGPPRFNASSPPTEQEWRQELAELRTRMNPYLRDFTPSLPDLRLPQDITEMQWREETKEDQKEPLRPLNGDGHWQRVTLPHYGPPLGRAVTWYRTRINLSRDMTDNKSIWICFKGVDYRAHVFFNGAYLGSHEGFFAPFELNATSYARTGSNTLVIKVENDFIFMGSRQTHSPERLEGEKLYAATGCGYDDPKVGWHHCPPAMGIYQPVWIEARSALSISDIFVRPFPDSDEAEAWIEIQNDHVQPAAIELDLSLYGLNFEHTEWEHQPFHPQSIHIPGAGDVAKRTERQVDLLMGAGANVLRFRIPVPNSRRWEPDTPWLYQLHVRLHHADTRELLDTGRRSFGMRTFRMETETPPLGRFFLNNREIKLRGVNTMGHLQQCVMNHQTDQLIEDILIAKRAHANFFRLTQRPVQVEIYEMCDRLGMMTQTDLPLFGVLRRPRFSEAIRQAQEMERLIRSHPCNILVTYINEPFPNAMDEPHRHLTRSELESFVQAADQAVHLLNPDRVIKAFDGDYDPPGPGLPDNHCYCGWYNGHGIDLGQLHKGYWQRVKPDWTFGCGEYGAEGLDPLELMHRHYPSRWLPTDDKSDAEWTPDRIEMAQTGRFHYLWFETPESPEQWVAASQHHQARMVRMMTEAFRRLPGMNSFALHLLIDAFPAGWMKAVVDCERHPKPAYFDFSHAMNPLFVGLRTDRTSCYAGETLEIEAWIANDAHSRPDNGQLIYQALCGEDTVVTGQCPARIPEMDVDFQGFLSVPVPDVKHRSRLRVSIRLEEETGTMLHDNTLSLSVWPKTVKTSSLPLTRIIGSESGPARQLAHDLALPLCTDKNHDNAKLLLIDDINVFQNIQTEVNTAVELGALAVWLNCPPGVHSVGGSTVRVNPCGMGKRHFVSTRSGHPLVRDFEPDDFQFWTDNTTGMITPLLSSTLEANGWSPILMSGNGSWSEAWSPQPAVVEKAVGRGGWRLCQVHLNGRIVFNPAAHRFARRLVSEPVRG